MKKKLLCLLLTGILAIATLAACASSNPTDSSTAAPVQSQDETTAPANDGAAAEPSSDPANMRFMWWGGDTRHEKTLKAIERYSELYPNVTIEAEYQGYDGYHQKIMTQIAGQNEPDIVQLDYIWFTDLSQQGDIFVDLSTAPAVDLSGYNPTFLDEYCSMNGKIISLPMGTNGYGIIINKQFFEKHGIPTDTQFTWQSLIQEAAKVNQSNPTDYLFATESSSLTGFIFEQYVMSKTGAHWMADDSSAVRVGRDDLIETFSYIQSLFSSPGIQPLGEASLFAAQMEQNPIWANNQLGFVIEWSGGLGKFGSIIGDENLAAGNPIIVEGGRMLVPTKPSMVAAVSNRSQHIDVGTHFINWLMTDTEAVEILETQRSVPTNQNAMAHLESIGAVTPLMAQMVQVAMDNPAPAPPSLSFNSEIGEMVGMILEEVAYSNVTPEAAADGFIADVNDKLASLNA